MNWARTLMLAEMLTKAIQANVAREAQPAHRPKQDPSAHRPKQDKERPMADQNNPPQQPADNPVQDQAQNQVQGQAQNPAQDQANQQQPDLEIQQPPADNPGQQPPAHQIALAQQGAQNGPQQVNALYDYVPVVLGMCVVLTKAANDINTIVNSDDHKEVDTAQFNLALDIMGTLGAISELVRRTVRRNNQQRRNQQVQPQNQ